MIKKIIGIVVALAAIGVIVIVAIYGDKFSSLVFDQGEPASAVEAQSEPAAVAPESVVIPDTTSVTVHADSLRGPIVRH